jgi:SEC-C motif domain protein
MTDVCLCDCGKPFEQCCEPLLKGNTIARTPKQLMRSRYTAYALGGYGEYLIATWLPETSKGLTPTSLSEKTLEWVKLEVLHTEQKGDEGSVEFNAYYKDDKDSLNILHEKSRFKRVDRHWFYVEGKVKMMEVNKSE